MKTIPLTQGRAARVDDADYPALCAIGRWCFAGGYAVHYYTDRTGQRKRLFMHRVIMERVQGGLLPAGYQVDHISRDRLDNRRANLRLATRSQNQAAKGVQVNSSSGMKGVNWRAGKWEVRLRYQHKRLYLGRYDSPSTAQAVYAYAHRLLWGEFSTEQSVPVPPVGLRDNIISVLATHAITPCGL
ncbi:MAG: HNH endonuclease [Anaerolineae bacterium]